VGQNLDYDFPLSESFLEPEVIGGVLLIISIVALGILVRRSSPLIGFGIIWFFVTLSPTSSVVPLPDVIFEHRLYIPLAGFVFVLTGIMAAFMKHRRPMTTVVIVGLLLFSVGTYRRNSVWKDELMFWQDTVRKSPRKARPHVNLAGAYIELGEYDEALAELSRALFFDPACATAYDNMSKVYLRKGEYELALPAAKKAVDLAPNQASPYNALGETYMHLGKKDLAAKNFSKALSIDRFRQSARNNLASLLAEKGLYLKAIQEFEQVLRLDPNHKEAAFNLAHTYTLSGQINRAVRQYQEVIEKEPDYLAAYHNLAMLYLYYLHRPDDAKRCLEQALTLAKDPLKTAEIRKIITQIETAPPKPSE
jgi:tetratricopeptide (TPR) repeat protein